MTEYTNDDKFIVTAGFHIKSGKYKGKKVPQGVQVSFAQLRSYGFSEEDITALIERKICPSTEWTGHEEFEDWSPEQRMSRTDYILDETQIVQVVPFPSCILPDGKVALGVFLSRNVPVYTGKTKKTFSHTEQHSFAVLLASDGEFIEIGPRHELHTMIQVKDIPVDYSKRISLARIQRIHECRDTPVDLKRLFDRILKTYKRYVWYRQNEWYIVRALWDMGTYVLPAFDMFPILESRGLKGTGKSRGAEVSQHMTFNSTGVQVNPTESSMFRDRNDSRSTMYIDEAEKLFFKGPNGKQVGDSRAELLNASVYRNGKVARTEQENRKFVVRFYNCYGATQVMSINGLLGATEDRAIVQICTKPPRGTKKYEKEPRPDSEPWQEIRDDLYSFFFQFYARVRETYDGLESSRGIENRDFQIWRPLLSIAKLVDDDLYGRVLDFAAACVGEKHLETFSEKSWEYKSLSFMNDVLKGSEKVYVSGIASSMGDTVASKTASNFVDKLGFKAYKKRDSKGNFYLVDYDTFKEIAINIIPSLFSTLSTQSTSSYEDSSFSSVENKKENVENVESTARSSVENVTNVDNVGTSDSDVLSYVRENKQVDKLELGHKFGLDRVEYHLRRGELYEPRKGWVRVLE